MKIYLSGPMTGRPEYNYPEFNRVAKLLREMGHDVFNPAEWWRGPIEEFPIRRAFAAYSEYISLYADAIYLLPGWTASKGARAEHALAIAVGIDVHIWNPSK